MDDSKEIKLTRSFTYHHANNLEQAQFITITPYTMKQMDKVAPVKEIVLQAMSKFTASLDAEDVQAARDQLQASNQEHATAETAPAEDDVEETMEAKQLMSIIYGNCKEGGVKKLWAYMNKLLTSGICAIDGEIAFTGDHIRLMSPGDFENLCGEYIGNFMVS